MYRKAVVAMARVGFLSSLLEDYYSVHRRLGAVVLEGPTAYGIPRPFLARVLIRSSVSKCATSTIPSIRGCSANVMAAVAA